MATKLNKIASVPGMDVVRLFMEIVKDQEKYDKIVSEIDEKTAKANALIELIAPAKQIETLHAEATAAKLQAEQIYTKAVNDAGRRLEEAEKLATETTTEAQEVLDNATAHAERTQKERATFEAEKVEAEEYLQERKEALDRLEVELQKQVEVLEVSTKEHEDRAEKLRVALH